MENNSPVVSIITPAYNCEGTLSETIQSVQAQVFLDWEMIIVDDGSVDGTFALAESYAAEDSRVRVFQMEANQGAGPARNFGIELARGRFLAFLDSDDLWYKDKLYSQVNFMIENDVVFSYHDYDVVDEWGEVINRVLSPNFFYWKDYIKNTAIGVLSIIIDRNEVSIPKMASQPATEAVNVWVSVMRDHGAAIKAPGCYSSYRIRRGSVSRNKIRSAYWYWRSLVDNVGLSRLYSSYVVCIAASRSLVKNNNLLKAILKK
ncbi:glycosyltransferase family 2 protein [Halomonas almeriensis]|uniref:glycosyltransferase family 2 protein n=1 Tax=Halomonas almeriensis TaxID=308163 RepID=UPI0025B3FA88|nr:glycosyltransferase family 2 protein [Halomonas almeriensis]MDN3552596.1 glycosyltransferase family 2 protein [Halomonas almeriensis]